MIRNFLALLITCLSVLATDWNAASPSIADITAAAASALPGDRVLIPAGSATWASRYDRNSSIGIQFVGAGTNSTIITCSNLGSQDQWLIRGLNSTSAPVRVTGIQFVCNTVYSVLEFSCTGTNTSLFRVDNCLFKNLTTRGVSTASGAYGVVDHCWFNVPVSATGVSPDSGDPDYSSNQWNHAWSPSSTNCVTIENCTFDWQTTIANGTIDMYAGQSMIFRWNTITNGNIGAHGTDSGGSLRSILGADVYNNTLYFNISGFPYSFRGGSVQIHSNNVVILSGGSGTTGKAVFSQYRNSGTNVYGGPNACCSPFGGVTRTNHWDGQQLTNGWPALDQLGRTGPSTYGATNTTQASMPCYLWDNVYNGSGLNDVIKNPDVVNTGAFIDIDNPTNMIQVNRDYYLDTPMPGYATIAYPHPLVTFFDGGGSPSTGPYYISPTGNNSNDGLSTNTPWLFGKGLTNLGPDKIVYAMSGSYTGAMWTIDSANSGSNGHNATLKSLTKWGAIIANSTNNGINLSYTPYVTNLVIDGFCVSNSVGDGIGFVGHSNYIRNCWIVGNTNQGINASNAGCSNNVIEMNLVEYNGRVAAGIPTNIHYHGIYLVGPNNVVRGNVSRHNYSGYAFQYYTEDAGVLQWNSQIYENQFYGQTNLANIDGQATIWSAILGGASPGTNYVWNNTIDGGLSASYGVVCATNNIIFPSTNSLTQPIIESGSRPPAVRGNYNGSTVAFTTAGANDFITNSPSAWGFVNTTTGLYWLTSGSVARSRAQGISLATDFFGNASPTITDLGAFQYSAGQASDTRTLDPNLTGADYWSQLSAPATPPSRKLQAHGRRR